MPDKQLNPQQTEAITHKDGPLLIVAGAGTGKTTVVTERIKWLISEGLAQPDEILALTFTEKAAKEMEERIDVAMPYGYTQTWTMTFHSFCDRVLKDHGIHIGINSNFRLMMDTTATSLMRRHLFDLNLSYFRPTGNPNKFISGILQHIGRLKDEDISSEEYSLWTQEQVRLAEDKTEVEKLEAQKFQELANIYKLYEEVKTNESVVDFADLISMTLKLFRTRANILEQYRAKFKYILVDEFQDTNYAQNQLVNLLVSGKRNLTVVADDDQAIYRWRGAAVSNVIQFRSDYPDAKLVTLTQNYRSTQEILDRSYDLIQHNNPDRLEVREKIDKKLVSIKKRRGDKVEFIHRDRVENEADAVSLKINEIRLHDPSLEYKDFAVLVRANAHSDPFVKSFERHGIPYQFLGPGQLFHQPEVKDLIAYLRVLNDIGDDPSFSRVISMGYFGISGRDMAAIGTFSKKHNLHLFETSELLVGKSLRNISEKPLVSEEAIGKFEIIINVMRKHLELLSKDSAGQILFSFLQDSGMLQSILDYKPPVDEKMASNILSFFNKLKSYEAENKSASVRETVEWIDLCMELGESPLATDTDWSTNDAVNIITIHSAKGLEFPVVFLANLVSQRFPSIERQEQIPVPDALIKETLPGGDHHLQEERRLCYVGMTRAKDKLFLTAANFYGEGKREKKLSPFILEALGEIPEEKIKQDATQLSLLDWEKPKVTILPNEEKHALGIKVDYLSYTQIQAFLDCPLHYKARYILKIPSVPTASLTFGSVVHKTLNDFYISPSTSILDIYKRNWLSEGYLNSHQEQEFFKKGQKYLSEYIEKEYIQDSHPALLEKNFIAPISFEGKFMKIGGKIDRVDVLSDGTIEIFDYKTGANSLSQKEAETNLQLSFYALAATLVKEPPFNKKPEQIKLTLYYFDEQKKVTTTRTASQLDLAKAEIFKVAEEISQSDFKCSHSQLCRQCEYNMLCDMRN